MKSIPVNQALIPRKNISDRGWRNNYEEDAATSAFTSYAPPGASIRAQVKALPLDDKVQSIMGAEKGNFPHASTRLSIQHPSDQVVVLRIETLVTFQSPLSLPGMKIETTALFDSKE